LDATGVMAGRSGYDLLVSLEIGLHDFVLRDGGVCTSNASQDPLSLSRW
jgi:hypothetical protein